jgi:hypothetical protein
LVRRPFLARSLAHPTRSVKIKSSYNDKVKNINYATNRMIHRRFLDRSEAWRISGEAAAELAKAANAGDDDADVALAALAVINDDEWRPLTRDHFFNNEEVVANRIKIVLRRAPQNMAVHTDLIPLVVRPCLLTSSGRARCTRAEPRRRRRRHAQENESPHRAALSAGRLREGLGALALDKDA